MAMSTKAGVILESRQTHHAMRKLLTSVLVISGLMMSVQNMMSSTQLVAAPPAMRRMSTVVTSKDQTTLATATVKTTNTSRDDRFREEIRGYYHAVTLPDPCSEIDATPPRPVKSQSVYTNCFEPRVPNIVHLVWLYGAPYSFTFKQLLSALSMLRFIQPCCILFWYDGNPPTGNYWEHFIANITARNIHMQMLNITVPDKIWGKKIAYKEHRTDIIRFEVLQHFGGIYMDLDVLILKSVRPLRCFDYTLGKEDSIRLTDSLIFSVPKSPFLLKVIDNYKNYSTVWNYNSVDYPSKLADQFPSMIHIEEDTINIPSWTYIREIYDDSCTIMWLHKNYALHLWEHQAKVEKIPNHREEDANSIRTLRSTFGQVARYIYYGELDRCK